MPPVGTERLVELEVSLKSLGAGLIVTWKVVLVEPEWVESPL